MSFRAKLLAAFAVSVVLAVGLVAWIVSASMRDAFERLDSQRTAALVAQFQREFTRRAGEVTERVEGIANAEDTLRMAVDLGRASPDYSAYVDAATGLAAAHQLDFLELTTGEGAIVSSAQWPARFGYKEAWLTEPVDWAAQGAFLKREDLADGVALALMAVRVARAGDKKLYVVGGRRLDKEFLASLVLPAGTRALLYQNLIASSPRTVPITGPNAIPPYDTAAAGSVVDASGPIPHAEKLQPLITRVENLSGETSSTIIWTDDPASAETFQVIPLAGRNQEILGMFLVGSLRREQIELENHIRAVAIMVGVAGILLGVILSGWIAGRVTQPVLQLAAASRQVAEGNWGVRVEPASSDELGQLARAFNQMTQQLVEQRDRLVQSERVAAWRELARRLAHELKNPLFPLQITVENLLRARENDPSQFDEVFRESTSTLLAELANMRMIVGRFSDFAKMPPPQLQPVNLNVVVSGALKLFDAQLNAPGKKPIAAAVDLDPELTPVQADPDLLHLAVQNLILNALDAMPSGGTLTLRTRRSARGVRLEVSDTGKGLTQEECERLFTPYYTTKQHGTGLGLAIVQSVISDHGGNVSVESEPERGTTFVIDLPAQPPESVKQSKAEG
jgi:two-component system nitrogen regulation sensor histidine kinase NtrY